MKVVAVIPARYGSTRFPGKPLVVIDGKPMIQRVYEQCIKARLVDRAIVATDDRRIVECVKGFNGEAVMTSKKHESGTDRIIEAVRDVNCDIVLNVQGDEPFIHPANIDKVIKAFSEDESVNVATLAVCFRPGDKIEDPNKVKVVIDRNGDALYFSRSVIPNDSTGEYKFMKHLGIYAFRKDFLMKYAKMKRTKLEQAEKLEQLRILENGHKIRVIVTSKDSSAVDTPEDLARILLHGRS
jgi:3-deoxy-manno-octulosonate cytidylyltransferase (CMP-KDO synthetase)